MSGARLPVGTIFLVDVRWERNDTSESVRSARLVATTGGQLLQILQTIGITGAQIHVLSSHDTDWSAGLVSVATEICVLREGDKLVYSLE
ncbi:hypothetical protein B0G80_5907 [Paraburkholderia sp. BL6669N2]|nr:hypothetical protein B0G80_5907 [Paraburkholderia sp. BL6669N2]